MRHTFITFTISTLIAAFGISNALANVTIVPAKPAVSQVKHVPVKPAITSKSAKKVGNEKKESTREKSKEGKVVHRTELAKSA